MTEPLSAEQFRTAVADAVVGVLNVYREADITLRELGSALAIDAPHFRPLIKRLVPGVSKKTPEARYLRSYVAAFFTANGADDEEPDDDDEEGEEEEDEGESKSRQALTIANGSGILFARVAIYQLGVHDFEPNLLIGTLARCRADQPVASDAVFRVPRSRFKRIMRAVDAYRGAVGKPLRPDVLAQLEGQPKGKAKHSLLFDVPQPFQRYPLFDITPDKLAEIARAACAAWPAATGVSVAER